MLTVLRYPNNKIGIPYPLNWNTAVTSTDVIATGKVGKAVVQRLDRDVAKFYHIVSYRILRDA